MKFNKLNYKALTILGFLIFFLTSSLFWNSTSGTSARYAVNWDDQTPEIAFKVNDNTYGDMENLRVDFNMGEGTCIITGLSYKYNNVGSGPYDVDIRFVGDDYWVGYNDSNIPHVSADSWRTFRCLGPTYLLDDDSQVHFIGSDPSDNCISLCADTPSRGHSYYNIGSVWVVDDYYEYIVELIYEHVVDLPAGFVETGSITSSDFVDAYSVILNAGTSYDFELEQTSGSGNLNMRLVSNKSITNENLTQSSVNYKLEYITYTPSISGTYVLLVEPNSPISDIADYSVKYYETNFFDEKDAVPIVTTNNRNERPQICSDGNRGAIISWQDYRIGNHWNLFAQRINSAGEIQWIENGIPICKAENDQMYIKICSDGNGGAIMAWKDYRNGNWDMYAQRVNSTGDVQWKTNGISICKANQEQQNPKICSDGNGGAIISWQDFRNGNWDIYSQRVNSTGDVQWNINGIPICTASHSQAALEMCSDGNGGAIMTWMDWRKWIGFYYIEDIYAQKVNSAGDIQWMTDGIPICLASETQRWPEICSDGNGGAFISWADMRGDCDIFGCDHGIYAQRVNSAGDIQWITDGIKLGGSCYYEPIIWVQS